VPYVMALVKGGPNPDNGKKVLDFTLSDEGQRLWANAYMRPVRAEAMTPDVAAKFLPAGEYARAKAIDLKAMANAQKAVQDRYQREVQ
jgi:putative spermidine/putrescine transport system substrate-binding protein